MTTTDFALAFIPIFVAVDPIGILPIFVSLTEGLDPKEKRIITIQSLWTALVLAMGFILLGKMIFHALGITVADFMVAGGIILFCIAIMDLLSSAKRRRIPGDALGVVPIGTPLIVGPGVLTTSLLLLDQYGLWPTLMSVLVNLMIVGVVFFFSGHLIRFFGAAGSRALSKVMALLLAAIAVKMIRSGLMAFVSAYSSS